jgi:hypothetical protein
MIKNKLSFFELIDKLKNNSETKPITPLNRKNYGSIPHMSGSKKNQQADRKILQNQEAILTEKTRNRHEVVIVTEKLDGTNVGIAKINGKLIALGRAGYDVRTSEFEFIRRFQYYLDEFESEFFDLLGEGERVVGEWMIKTHTLEYHLIHEPFVAFDLFDNKNRRKRLADWYDEAVRLSIPVAHIIHYGGAIKPERALELAGDHGFHGCLERPEGLVYRLEDRDKVLFLAKYVRSGVISGLHMKDETRYNQWLGNQFEENEKLQKKLKLLTLLTRGKGE